MDLFGEEPKVVEAIIEEAADAPPEATQYAVASNTTALMYGHDDVEKLLLEQFNSGRMPHALIFSGPSGIGKATMAYRLARFLLKNKPADAAQDSMFTDAPVKATNLNISEEDPVFRRVASGAHPDLLTVRREYDEAKSRFKASVAVDDIRRIPPFLHMKSSDGGWRVVIIDDADTMTVSSQNALLKVLEEPPPNTVLILIAHRVSAMVPTIRSRSRLIPFNALDENAMHRLLQVHGHTFEDDQIKTLIYLSGGSFGRAMQLVEEGGLEVMGQALEIFESCPDWDWLKIHALADQLSGMGRDQAFASFANIIPWIMRQLTLAKARGAASCSHPLNGSPFTNLMQNSSLEGLSKICENLEEHFNAIQYANLDKKQGVIGAFSLIS